MRCRSFLWAPLFCALSLFGCGDDGEPKGTVGRSCEVDTDCGEEGVAYCGRGFTQLAGDDTPDDSTDALGAVGLLMPPDTGYCMQTAGCLNDSECPNGSACYRPLVDVDPASVGFATADLEAGHCLVPCTDSSDCRADEGFVCGVPLEHELAGVAGVDQSATFCIPEPLGDPCAPNPAWNTAGTCTLTYDIEGAFEITHTPLGAGDGAYSVGPGKVVVRVPSADGLAPSDGDARVLCFDIAQTFTDKAQKIFTVTRAYSTAAGADGLNGGTLTEGTLEWGVCDTSASYCSADAEWTLSAPATGPGCLPNYRSVGDVICNFSDPTCRAGMLVSGHNPQDATWTQRIHPFVFSGGTHGFESVEMNGPTVAEESCSTNVEGWISDKMQIPNEAPGRTWMSFAGTLRSMECRPAS